MAERASLTCSYLAVFELEYLCTTTFSRLIDALSEILSLECTVQFIFADVLPATTTQPWIVAPFSLHHVW